MCSNECSGRGRGAQGRGCASSGSSNRETVTPHHRPETNRPAAGLTTAGIEGRGLRARRPRPEGEWHRTGRFENRAATGPGFLRAPLGPGVYDALDRARASLHAAVIMPTANERYATAHIAALRTAGAVIAARAQGRPKRGP